jgi:hypothetical protein
MKMREVLDPADCDKMKHFFNFLLSTDSKKAKGHKLDITAAIKEYRKTYGTPETSEKQKASLKRTTENRTHYNEYQPILEKYRCYPVPFVAKMIGRDPCTVAHWYKVLKIERLFNYKGRRFDGVIQ